MARNTSAAKPADIILQAAPLIRERVEDVAATMTREQGKTVAESRLEFLRGGDIIEWDATEGRRVYGREPTGSSVIRSPKISPI